MVKPGKGYVLEGGETWTQIRTYGLLNGKVMDVHASQSHAVAIHKPKVTPLLAIHETRKSSIILTCPIPFNYLPEDEEYKNMKTVLTPEGEELMVSMTHQRYGDVPYIFGQRNKKWSNFAESVKDYAVNDDGRIVAVLFDDALWVWNQVADQVRGDGWWVNLAQESGFNFRKWEVAGNRPLAFQSISVFRNPDELSGVCLLSSLLPPCKPFNEMYLFNHICLLFILTGTFIDFDMI